MIEQVCKSCSAVNAGIDWRTRCDSCRELIASEEDYRHVTVAPSRAGEQRQFHFHAACLPPGFDVESKRTIGGPRG